MTALLAVVAAFAGGGDGPAKQCAVPARPRAAKVAPKRRRTRAGAGPGPRMRGRPPLAPRSRPARGRALICGVAAKPPVAGPTIAPAETVETPAAPAAPPAPAAPSPPAPSPVLTPPAPAPLPRRLQVDEGEWYVRPSRTRVGAGTVEMNVTNFGEDAHDLAVLRGGATFGQVALESGETKQLFVTLDPGSYRLICTLLDGDHEAAGMKATLEVAAG